MKRVESRESKDERRKTKDEIDESLLRLNISIFWQMARMRPDLVEEAYFRLKRQKPHTREATA